MSETSTIVLGISVLLSFCVGSIKKTVELLQEAGLRDKVKVVVGGYTVGELVKDYTGVDFYANDVSEALRFFREILDRTENNATSDRETTRHQKKKKN